MLFVRPISQYESQQLYQLVRKSRNVITVKRAKIIIASSQGMTVSEIERLYHCSQEHVRQVIRKFNKEGLKALYPKRGGDRPAYVTGDGSLLLKSWQKPRGNMPKKLAYP